MFHSNSPWSATGYGQQCAIFVPRLASLGHEVFISAFWGLQGASTNWNGHLVLPGGQDPYGSDIIASHAKYVRADLVITLMDVWPLDPGQVRGIREGLGIPVAHWMPVDCDPLGAMDEKHLRQTGAIPVAMSRYGQSRLAAAGLDPLYVPHGIETRTFTPDNRDAARKTFGVDGRFAIGLNAANKDAVRKGFPEQMAAFAAFRRNHPEALLMIHSAVVAPGALDLRAIAAKTGIEDAVRFADQYAYLTGMLTPQAMATWMSAADLGTNCSYGEGFGLASIEFQSCGTPVAVTDSTAMSELAGPGWKVAGEPFWNSAHAAWWVKPYMAGIVQAYEEAYEQAASKRQAAREFAVQYDADTVLRDYWKPALDAIMERANAGMPAGALPAPGTGRLASDDERDAVMSAVASLYDDGLLLAAEFAARAVKAMTARTPADLAGLADLPAAA